MTTLYLSPKNPAMLALLGIGLVWLVTRKPANAHPLGSTRLNISPVVPSRANATVQQQAQQAAANARKMDSFGGIFSGLFSGLSGLKPSGITEDARKAVRAGDSYYGGSPDSMPSFGGVTPGFNSDNTQARNAVRANDSYYNAPPSGDDTSANPVYVDTSAGDDPFGYMYT